MYIISLILMALISIFLVYVSYHIHGITAFNIFYIGMIIFHLLGAFFAYMLADNFYVLNGDTRLINNIVMNIFIFWIMITFFLFFQPSKKIKIKSIKKMNIDFDRKMIRRIFIMQLFVTLFLTIILFKIDLTSAPLLNIGTYSTEEMTSSRGELYSDIGFLNYPRFIVYYMLIPIFFFLKGNGFRINIFFLIFCLFFSLLTLSKTMFVLLIVFYFFGKFLRDFKKRHLIKMLLMLILGFYVIVFSTYMVDAIRGFFDVLQVFFLRMVVTPISLAGIYADLFSFEMGLRSSIYYTYIFGGTFAPIAEMVMSSISTGGGNSPTGIIGSAYPNIPLAFHFLYYLIFIVYVVGTSYFIMRMKQVIVRNIFVVTFGLLSWFIYLTHPLVALNSYGLLYITFVIPFILFFQKYKIRL